MTVATKKAVSKKNATSKKNSVKKEVETKAVEAVAQKNVSNTQKCANLILQFARDAKYTRNEIVQAVSDALKALSIVTVKTMMSDLHNVKYAKRYADHTIKTDRESKIVSINAEIKA